MRLLLAVLVFLLPAIIFLGIWIVYPAIYTLFRSFFGQSGFDNFVGIDNYKTLFTSDLLLTAIKNNAIWVAVVPAFVTASRRAPSLARIRPAVRSQTMRGRSSANSSDG